MNNNQNTLHPKTRFFKTTQLQSAINIVLGCAVVALAVQTQILQKDHISVRELNVERLNVMEPTGHPRLVLANTAHAPKAIKQGKVVFDPGQRPGMIFYNDEGTENGGLIFRGKKVGDNIEHGLHLSFDRYNQDQVVALQHIEQDGMLIAGLNIVDRPQLDFDIYMELALAAEKGDKTAIAKLEALDVKKDGSIHGARRAFYGTFNNKAMLQLNDPSGKKRIEMAVNDKGEPQLVFFDDKGAEILRLPEQKDLK